MKNTGHSPQSRSAVPRWYQILALVRDTRSEANSRAASAQAPSSPAERPIIPALVLPTNVVRPSLSASVARFLRVVGNGCCFSKTALGIAFAKEFEALAGEEDTGAMAAHRLFEVEKCGLWWEIEYRDGIVCAEHAAGLDGDDVVAHDHACYL
ncbi:hypothetical protein I4F81_005671 [Pyropia yezoensis]|uniref:Uncharacterized protein n=1 Tax=Pyropia yezoensis TaxID=2788 RepID=A0ACC3BZ22_PYRYE|nr:hypothetical protein I4F81_005671 [Neopyropia yezoensis]